ncbi:30S ribosomal protein S6 [Candidatus Purcelliella pentastirinorum]|uniref:30S ribosomal protein S6 n=1 Tax=Candidatus Purcelliella pentastirinorum TaxID=472834 RepID=UPI002367E0B2|nr:30S ribosomal protein S6 [Candidatus Purcelliella pentastirinorum]WDI79096.1 30S ribosomal protein S6 [Candidatus Purcelliella pentastirinorum]WDR80235.1 30S ribosomal protein S6 [Candidatus Purcelliella pentastirinorum]
MRYYEIVLMIHPDQSEFILKIIDDCKRNIINLGGIFHYLEDWGRLQLAYPIKKLHKSHYILMYIEILEIGINKLKKMFSLNENIIRNIIIKIKKINKIPSPIMKVVNENKIDIGIDNINTV